uniref:N-acyl-aliphatic-L-amino acid amidohydrolase n=1 Tax=Ailuropoda melanoleuca TaxID=9646 RepID=A0A7N5JNV2_AILME
MARHGVYVLGVAAVLLLGISTVSRSKGLKGREHQRASQIPSQFSPGERFAMKEALKGAIRIPTVFCQQFFPTVFKTSFIQHEVVGEYSHLLTVRGSDPSLHPYMLMAHSDVVPAPDEGWEVPPFSGLEHDGFIHGQGTLDNKNSDGLKCFAILQALELLLKRNYIPRRSFSIALGHGHNGAQKISALLQTRGVKLAFIVDEKSGGPSLILSYRIAGSEKGLINLSLQVNMTPGHSSAPPKETSISILAAAVSRLEQTPMLNMFGSGPSKMTLQELAHEFPFPANIILSNLWLFGPLVSRFMERSYITNTLVRTTMALIMFNAGVNVIPPVAQAIINMQIHPAQTVQEVLDLIKNIVADSRVQFHVLNAFDPLPVSPSDHQALGYQLLHQIIQSIFPEVSTVVPGNDFISWGGREVGAGTVSSLMSPAPPPPQLFSLETSGSQSLMCGSVPGP